MGASKNFRVVSDKPNYNKQNNNRKPNDKKHRSQNRPGSGVKYPKINNNPMTIDNYKHPGSRATQPTNRQRVDLDKFIQNASDCKIVYKIYGVKRFRPTSVKENTKAFVKLHNFEGRYVLYDVNRRPHADRIKTNARFIEKIYEYNDKNIVMMCSDGWEYYAEPMTSLKQSKVFTR